MNVLRVIALAMLMSCAGIAEAWWNDEWQFRKELAVDTSAVGAPITSTLSNVPVLVRLHLGNFAYFGDAKPDGSDIRFVGADDITPLPFHIEKFDPVAQVALIWVQLPQIAPALPNQSFFMYYGNPDAQAGGAAGQTYDKSHTMVLHFDGENAMGDKTAYANNPSLITASPEAAGLIGQGIRFAGQQSLQFQISPSLSVLPDKGWTLSAWIKVESEQAESVVVEHEDVIAGRLSLILEGMTPAIDLALGEVLERIPASAQLQVGAWHHLAYVIEGGAVRLFLDGAEILNHPVTLPQLNGRMLIGESTSELSTLNGVVMDELRINNLALPMDAVLFAVQSEGMNGQALRYGEDTIAEGESESHFVTTLRNVQWSGLEGYVIFLCVFMAIASWYVMVSKMLLVERVRRANSVFLDDYLESEELDSLYNGGDEQRSRYLPSTVAEVYTLGIGEIERRMATGSAGAMASSSVSPESMAAVRATLVGHNVRMSQKMNNLMVLLTLAIAGGPFLGLLGTVVGVIVTFAGIAASGDVNINAIAPGIAAALVATVAGLGVAIPALFGYNYISSRIKEVITEDNVFLEEFMSAAVETYQGGSRLAG